MGFAWKISARDLSRNPLPRILATPLCRGMNTEEGPETNSARDDDDSLYTPPSVDHTAVMGNAGKAAMVINGSEKDHPVEPEHTKDHMIECLRTRCEDLFAENERFRQEYEELQQKHDKLKKQIEENRQLLTKNEEMKKQDEDRIRELRATLYDLEEEYEKQCEELQMRNRIAEGMKRENVLLKAKMEQQKAWADHYKASAEEERRKCKRLCEQLERNACLEYGIMISEDAGIMLYRCIVFCKQQDTSNTWKVICVFIKNTPQFRLLAVKVHGENQMFATSFNTVQSTVKLSSGVSRLFHNWSISPDRLPKLKRSEIDDFCEGRPLPTIEFSVKCTSERCIPEFRHRFYLKGTSQGVIRVLKFFTVCLPH